MEVPEVSHLDIFWLSSTRSRCRTHQQRGSLPPVEEGTTSLHKSSWEYFCTLFPYHPPRRLDTSPRKQRERHSAAAQGRASAGRSEERRVGKEGVCPGRSRWSQDH